EEGGQALEPLAQALHALRVRREVARHQRIEAVADDEGEEQWIVGPRVDAVERERPVVELVDEDGAVDARRRSELRRLDPGERGAGLGDEGALLLLAVGAEARPAAVEAVVAEPRRRLGAELEVAVDG